MSVNEPIMSSSPMALQNGDSEKKRSISSSLINFFNKIKNSNNDTHSMHNNNSNENYNDNTQNDMPQRKKKKLGYPDASSHYNNIRDNGGNDDFNSTQDEPLILYENDDSMEIIRPPILPILPVQRLKLLRQKQMLRLQNDSRLINHNNLLNNQSQPHQNEPLLQNTNMTPELVLPNQDYDQSVIIHKSGTPSPVKNSSRINELVLDSNNNIINKQPEPIHNTFNNNKTIQLRTTRTVMKPNKPNFEGTKWSGNFEYDLSEYDTKPKQSNNKTNNTSNNQNVMSVATIVNGGASPKISISKLNKFAESNQTKKLSKTKLDLLINGSKQDKLTSTISKPIPTANKVLNVKEDKIPKINISDKDSLKSDKKSNIILPTMGFDFIKDNETPSKKVAFSFNNRDNSGNKETESKPLLFSLNTTDKPKESTTAPKLSFSFGTGSKSKDGEEEEEPRRKKRAAPEVTIDMTKDVNKPSFSFGAIKTTEETSGTTADKKTSSFTFGTKPSTQTEEKVPVDKPTFSFGGISPKPKKPTFSFGTSTATTTSGKDSDEEEPRRKKLAFSFGSAPGASTATTATNETSTETKPSFSFGLTGTQEKKDEEKKTPSFSFGLNKPAITEEKKTPAFSFSTSASTTEEPAVKKTGLFSFDKKPSAETPAVTSTTDKSSFSFGAKPVAPAATPATTTSDKPSFSFGAKQAAPANTGNNPLFSLNKPAEAEKEKSTTPSFSFGAAPSTAITDANKDKPVNPLLSKPSFTFGTGASKENTPSPSTTPTPSFSFNKPTTDNSTIQLNKEANSLGVSLNNPLISKPSGFGNNTSAPKLFSGAPPAAANPPAPFTGGFSFSRQPTPGQPGTSATPGASLFGGMNNNNNANNNTGGFSLGLNSGSSTPGVNPLLSNNNNNNNGMQPGGSVFGGNSNPNTMFGGTNNNQTMGNSNFNFGQPQQHQQQQPQMPTFNPSSQVNIHFNQNASVNPMDIFGGSNNNNSNTNLNNNLTPQPSQFQTRKIARMRGSRR